MTWAAAAGCLLLAAPNVSPVCLCCVCIGGSVCIALMVVCLCFQPVLITFTTTRCVTAVVGPSASSALCAVTTMWGAPGSGYDAFVRQEQRLAHQSCSRIISVIQPHQQMPGQRHDCLQVVHRALLSPYIQYSVVKWDQCTMAGRNASTTAHLLLQIKDNPPVCRRQHRLQGVCTVTVTWCRKDLNTPQRVHMFEGVPGPNKTRLHRQYSDRQTEH
jgi:hypothetical protein